MVIKDSKVYSCGTSAWALGHGKETRRCFELKHIDLPFSAQVIQVSASDYNVAFLMQSGEIQTEQYIGPSSLKGTPCKQVATGNTSTVFLTREGHVYTVGGNLYGQLGHGDTLNRQVPSMVELLKKVGLVIHISVGPYYVLAVTEDGSVYSFGDGSDLCLGNGDTRDEQLPHAIQAFKTKGVHILRVCAGDEHAVAIDSNGYVYTWGRCDIGALGHGDENDKPTPEVLLSLKKHIAVQVCARKRKTFVVVEGGLVYGFGALGYDSLGFGHGGIIFHAVEKPRVLECLRPHRVLQVSTSKVHTVVITRGQLFGFGDNESYQLGLHSILSSKEPTEICINC
ncbi:Regulator of chromosome condensation RCC1 [Arabidopsis suecica]|uniref:Regulator of chromosome condensation RCC1 n=1 Tax=Arabidopsis suecica TaxID=45249 RepID=A0A8T2CU55_ARASU|nr:Regulator of chromosome condensation RCC1 [Arabidopsis suecica]